MLRFFFNSITPVCPKVHPSWRKFKKEKSNKSQRIIYCICIRTRQGNTVKYNPLPEGFPKGKVQGNS